LDIGETCLFTSHMATYNGPLSKAPAREALIDIQFAPALPEDVIEKFTEHAKARFERAVPMWQAVFGFSLGPDGAAQNPLPSKTAIGSRLESRDPPHVLQCRNNGFTFSRLSPYGSWDQLRATAKAEWDQFLNFAPPLVVNRIAVRYINELKLPIPFADFAEFFSAAPSIPPGLPQALSSFLQRVVIPDPENDCTSIVTQSLETLAPMTNYVPILLDIDVSRATEIEASDSERIWQGLDQLRVQKNRMFFAHITDKMVELLK
jgi:uncharacterized protein (TIGR04255 family)